VILVYPDVSQGGLSGLWVPNFVAPVREEMRKFATACLVSDKKEHLVPFCYLTLHDDLT
jgi:hypothetical protein